MILSIINKKTPVSETITKREENGT